MTPVIRNSLVSKVIFRVLFCVLFFALSKYTIMERFKSDRLLYLYAEIEAFGPPDTASNSTQDVRLSSEPAALISNPETLRLSSGLNRFYYRLDPMTFSTGVTSLRFDLNCERTCSKFSIQSLALFLRNEKLSSLNFTSSSDTVIFKATTDGVTFLPHSKSVQVVVKLNLNTQKLYKDSDLDSKLFWLSFRFISYLTLAYGLLFCLTFWVVYKKRFVIKTYLVIIARKLSLKNLSHITQGELAFWKQGAASSLRGFSEKKALAWILFFFLSLVGLIGRFDWSEPMRPYTVRSYTLSAYLYLLWMPVLYFSVERVLNSRIAGAIIIFLGLLFSAPYRWLGLDRYYSPAIVTRWDASHVLKPVTDWFPEAYLRLPAYPHEAKFIISIFLTLTVGLILILKSKFTKKIPGFYLFKAKSFWLPFLILVLVLTELWLHTSLRSPYTYVPHFEAPMVSNYWYHYYLFPNSQGAVNMDFHLYRMTEELFFGLKSDLTPLMTRAFPSYLAAQFSYFFNTFYVWIVLNLLAWWAGLYSLFSLGRTIIGSRVAMGAVILFASSPGPILYLAQPMIYVVAMCSVVLLLDWQRRIFLNPLFSPKDSLIFGAMIALFSLCYESQPWLLTLPLIGLLTLKNSRWLMLSLGIGFLFNYGFISLCHQLPHLKILPTFFLDYGNPVSKIAKMIIELDFLRLIGLFCKSCIGFFDSMLHAFNFSWILAIVGFGCLKSNPQKVFLGLVFLPAFMTYALMEMGENEFYIQFPRVVFSSYPGVYLLSAYALNELDSRLRPKRLPWLGKFMAWGILGLHIVLANIDIFGFPSIYFGWFYRHFGYSWPS